MVGIIVATGIYSSWTKADVSKSGANQEDGVIVTVHRALPDENDLIPAETERFRYYVFLENNSSERIKEGKVHFTIPVSDAQLKEVFSLSEGCQQVDREIVCDLTTAGNEVLAPGEKTDFFVVFDIVPPLACGTNIVASAWFEGNGENQGTMKVISEPLEELVSCQ